MIDVKKVFVKEIITVNTSDNTISINKWKQGKALYDIDSNVNWSDTNYTSFKNFVETEFPDKGLNLMYEVRNAYSRMNFLGYTWKEVQDIAKNTSFVSASKLASAITTKLPVADFISECKIVSSSKKTSTYVNNKNILVEHLPEDYMTKLETLLSAHGLGFGLAKRRYNVTQAFMDFLDKYVP